MSHRIQNNVGYKKIYPMSLWEDNNFCHYCGREASIETKLEWDHVPPLNVKIPEYLACDIRKTLVRSCSECNNLASDIPHMDYLERHFWLKSALLRRYKSILINHDGKPVDINEMESGFLSASIKNSELKYKEILNRIGFGINNLDNIDSPILDLKNKQHRLIRYVLASYLYGLPTEDDEEISYDVEIEYEQIEDEPRYYPFDDFIVFLATEHQCENKISCDKSYKKWCTENPSRFFNLELPLISPSKYFDMPWDLINDKVNMIIRNEYLLRHDEGVKIFGYLEHEKDINIAEIEEYEQRKISKAQKAKKNRLDLERYRANKTLRNNKGVDFTFRQKREQIYKLFGDKYNIVSMTMLTVTFRCPQHGLTKQSVNAMLTGSGCQKCKE